MKINFRYLIWALSFLFVGCSQKYYVCYVSEPTPFYSTQDSSSQIFTVPAGKQIISQRSKKKYRLARFGTKAGYVKSRKFLVETPYSSRQIKYLRFSADSTYDYAKAINRPLKSSNKNIGSNTKRSSYAPVQVKGYYRKNGTYVRPHTRSAPARRR